jgi:hypothetical protein
MNLRRNRMEGHGLDSNDSREKQVYGSCEHGNELSICIQCAEIAD